jgi:hypothetical protein
MVSFKLDTAYYAARPNFFHKKLYLNVENAFQNNKKKQQLGL